MRHSGPIGKPAKASSNLDVRPGARESGHAHRGACRARLQERLGALAALEPLVTFAVAPVALTFYPAGMAGHCESP